MVDHSPTPEQLPGAEPAGAALSRRRMLTVGVPSVVALAALGGAVFVIGSGDTAVRTGDSDPTATSSTTTTTASTSEPEVDKVFSSAGSSTETLPAPSTQAPSTQAPSTQAPTTQATTSTSTTPASSTSTSTTTTSTTSTIAPTTTASTLAEQPSQPIAPPPDPRGVEDQVRLGGIAIPKLGVDAPLLEGIRLTTLDNGPGHWPGTAMPGAVGNVVVAAHRTSHGASFRNIDQLVAGDSVTFDVGGGDIEYKVTGTQIVNPDAVWIVDPTDTPTATLFACHPPGSVRQRIVVNLELSA